MWCLATRVPRSYHRGSLLMFSQVMQRRVTVYAANPASRWSASLHYFSEAQ